MSKFEEKSGGNEMTGFFYSRFVIIIISLLYLYYYILIQNDTTFLQSFRYHGNFEDFNNLQFNHKENIKSELTPKLPKHLIAKVFSV